MGRHFAKTPPRLQYSHHRVLGQTPAEVNPNNEVDVWHHLYAKKGTASGKRSKFKVGDVVRLSKVKGAFAKGYLPNWTEEEFTVHEVNRKYKPIMYTIRDHRGEIIEGKFYDHELQRIENPEKIYMIERIVRRRQRPGQEREVLVKWLGYPETSWIKESSLINKPS